MREGNGGWWWCSNSQRRKQKTERRWISRTYHSHAEGSDTDSVVAAQDNEAETLTEMVRWERIGKVGPGKQHANTALQLQPIAGEVSEESVEGEA